MFNWLSAPTFAAMLLSWLLAAYVLTRSPSSRVSQVAAGALAAIGRETPNERERWFSRVAESGDEWVLEAKAGLLLDQDKPEQARAFLLG